MLDAEEFIVRPNRFSGPDGMVINRFSGAQENIVIRFWSTEEIVINRFLCAEETVISRHLSAEEILAFYFRVLKRLSIAEDTINRISSELD